MPGTLVMRTWTYDPTRHGPAKYKRACRYQPFIPDELGDLQLSFNAQTIGIVSEAEHAIRDLDERAGVALVPTARLLLRTESIASSRIEGMQLGVRELARAEAKLDTGAHASSTAVEILANIDAMSLAVDEAAAVEPFGTREIAAIHQRLVERTEHHRIAGRVRTQQNWIGGNDYNPCGADFVPPPPEDVDRLLTDLCDAINDDRLSPLVQAALVHAQFETIHPFDDGNGRTGRALIHVVLRRRGIARRYVPPISVVLAAAKERYIAGLVSFRGTGVEQWVEYFAAAATRSVHLAGSYLHEVSVLRDQWRRQLAQSPGAPRADAAAWELIDNLPAHPTITAAVAATATRRSRPQTYAAIEQLSSAGVLTPLSASRRNRAWEPTGLLDLMARFESGELG